MEPGADLGLYSWGTEHIFEKHMYLFEICEDTFIIS